MTPVRIITAVYQLFKFIMSVEKVERKPWEIHKKKRIPPDEGWKVFIRGPGGTDVMLGEIEEWIIEHDISNEIADKYSWVLVNCWDRMQLLLSEGGIISAGGFIFDNEGGEDLSDFERVKECVDEAADREEKEWWIVTATAGVLRSQCEIRFPDFINSTKKLFIVRPGFDGRLSLVSGRSSTSFSLITGEEEIFCGSSREPDLSGLKTALNNYTQAVVPERIGDERLPITFTPNCVVAQLLVDICEVNKLKEV